MQTSLPPKEKTSNVPEESVKQESIVDETSVDYLELCARTYPEAKKTAALSIVPGLGQLKNGEIAKGILFLSIVAANFGTIGALSMSGKLAGYLTNVAQALHRQPNFELAAPFNASVLQSPAIFLYGLLVLSFVAYAMRDAYDGAVKVIRDGQTHPKYALQLPEATSGSYLFHFILMASLSLLVIFFVSPQPPSQQTTVIELMHEQPKPKTPDKPAPKHEMKKPVEKPKPIKQIVPPKVEPKVQKVVPPKPVPTPVAVAVPTKEPTPLTMAPVAAPAATPDPAPPAASSGGGGGRSGGTGTGESGSGTGEVDMGPWMKELQKKIKHAWYPPKGNESKRIKVSFKVHKDGHISRVRLASSSGVQVADDAALKALDDAAPFAALPDGAGDDVDINFTFDYNVFGAGRGR